MHYKPYLSKLVKHLDNKGEILTYTSGVCEEMRRIQLLSLPEPIMITGHTQPDADVISTAAALLNYFEHEGKQAYFSYRGSIPSYLRWCIPEDRIRKDDLESYESLIIVDCGGEDVRIGFTPKPSVPRLVLDHHLSSLEHPQSNPNFIAWDVPSTSTILPCIFGIYDPIIYVGLFYDSIALNKRLIESAVVLAELAEHGLTDEKIAEFHRKMEIKKDLELIDSIRDSWVSSIEIKPGVRLACVTSHGPVEYKHDLTAYYRQYFDGILLYMTQAETFSLRFEEKLPLDANAFASNYGGGGHKGAAGFSHPKGYINTVFQALIAWARPQLE